MFMLGYPHGNVVCLILIISACFILKPHDIVSLLALLCHFNSYLYLLMPAKWLHEVSRSWIVVIWSMKIKSGGQGYIIYESVILFTVMFLFIYVSWKNLIRWYVGPFSFLWQPMLRYPIPKGVLIKKDGIVALYYFQVSILGTCLIKFIHFLYILYICRFNSLPLE